MCVNPFQVKVTSRTFGTTRYVDAPCGYCSECLARHQNDWKLRIVHECNYWDNLYFFTLTYSNDSLLCRVDYSDLAYPEDPIYTGSYNLCKKYYGDCDSVTIRSTACKRDVQNFLKRLRENYSLKYGTRVEMKYFVCAEYGPNPNGTKRPHYHGIIMTNASYDELLPEFNAWQRDFGRMEFKQVGYGRDQSSKVANYISKYCSKGCFQSRIEDIRAGFIEKAWYIMSKNIGERWINENRSLWLDKVPKSLSIKGDWQEYDVASFFDSRTDFSLEVRAELESLIDSFFVFDGDKSEFKYKMPRYYRERLICVRKSFINYDILKKNGKPIYDLRVCESQLQSLPSSVYRHEGCASFALAHHPESLLVLVKAREDKRYVSENFLSVAFAYCLSLRAINRLQDKREELLRRFPEMSDFEIDLQLLRQREVANSYREQMSTQKLQDFYSSNMWKHPEFDFVNDFGEIDYQINL